MACGGSVPGATAPVPAPAAIEESQIVQIDDSSSASASRFTDGRIWVEIKGADASPRFGAEFRKTDVNKVQVDYSLYLLASEDTAARTESAAMELELDAVPSLDDAIAASVLIQTQFSNAVLGLYDNWGCDLLPGKFNWIASCGPKGKCCDVHDACYQRRGCSASSWKAAPWNKCQIFCNAPAVACFLTKNPGPSACCFRGNCGRPR
jgi:hypothetical protein